MRTAAPGQSALLLLDVAQILIAQKISYAVVGALAAAVHGEVRGTSGRNLAHAVSTSHEPSAAR